MDSATTLPPVHSACIHSTHSHRWTMAN